MFLTEIEVIQFIIKTFEPYALRNACTVLWNFQLYESLIFLSWTLSSIHIILENVTKNMFIGAILSPTTLFINSFALFNLPIEMQRIIPLIPALQSNWLMMHVTVMLLSYATLLSGSLISICFIIFFWIQKSKPTSSQLIWENINYQNPFSTFIKKSDLYIVKPIPRFTNLDFLKTLDNISYRLIGIGFAFLTIGILSGSVWANEAWGSYWSWDPKETWALITWINFAIYLHSRLIRGWEGIKPAVIAAFGFLIIWICYLGVNLLGKGLHSYGWFL